VQVDDILAGLDAADGDDLLIERIDDLAAGDLDDVVDAAEIVAIEMHQAGLAGAKPDEIAGRILDVEVDILASAVRPGERDEELGLGIDRTSPGDRIDQQEREHEHHDEAEQGVEQQIGEGDPNLARPPHGCASLRWWGGYGPR
jgi:hypothetical protein